MQKSMSTRSVHCSWRQNTKIYEKIATSKMEKKSKPLDRSLKRTKNEKKQGNR